VYSVLVIDDERMIRDLVKQALERQNYKVDTADNAAEGIAKFNTGRYSLVITDVRMPGVDGCTVASHIRSARPHTAPVIGLSGTPWLLQHGKFDEVLSKPFAIQTLIEKVQGLTKMPITVRFDAPEPARQLSEA